MYNHRKLKSSFFLRHNSYPEILLSRHKYYKKSGLYSSLNLTISPISFKNKVFQAKNGRNTLALSGDSTLSRSRESKVLLEGISHLYLNGSINQEDKGSQKEQSSRKGRTVNLSPTSLNVRVSSTLQKANVLRKDRKEIQRGGVKREESVKLCQIKEIVHSQNTRVDERGLKEMDSSSFTNGLLNVGHRYFYVL